MQKRQRALLYLFLVFAGLLILAAGLSNLHFQPALPFPGVDSSRVGSGAASGGMTYAGMSMRVLLEAALGLAFFLLLAVLIFNLARKSDPVKLARLVAGLVVLGILLYGLAQVPLPELDAAVPASEPQSSAPPTWHFETAPIGDPPPGLARLVIIAGLISAAALGGWLLYKGLKRPAAEDALAEQAIAALWAIEEGQDLKDVIIACYRRMLDTVRREQGIERGKAMTPREFEEVLRRRGVPAGPVHQLTALFEMARYSRRRANKKEEGEAVACLTAIREACKVERNA